MGSKHKKKKTKLFALKNKVFLLILFSYGKKKMFITLKLLKIRKINNSFSKYFVNKLLILVFLLFFFSGFVL